MWFAYQTIIDAYELRRNFSAEHKKIVYLSRVDACKGVDFLIKSFAKVAKSILNGKLIFGDNLNLLIMLMP